jgi:hypothetical protein
LSDGFHIDVATVLARNRHEVRLDEDLRFVSYGQDINIAFRVIIAACEGAEHSDYAIHFRLCDTPQIGD